MGNMSATLHCTCGSDECRNRSHADRGGDGTFSFYSFYKDDDVQGLMYCSTEEVLRFMKDVLGCLRTSKKKQNRSVIAAIQALTRVEKVL